MSRRTFRAGFLLWLVAVALLTLSPSAGSTPDIVDRLLCLWCAPRSTGDMILNWLLFIPAGLCLRPWIGVRRALLAGLAITLGIEVAQLFIPGRYPSAADVVLNTAGTWTGAWLAVTSRLRRAATVGAGMAMAAWLLPAVLMVPTTTGATLYGAWTPEFAGMAHYQGTVLVATVDGRPARLRVEESRSLEESLLARRPVEVTMIAADPPMSLAPIFAINDENRESHLLVGVLGEDIVIRPRVLAADLRLDQPPLRAVGALRGVEPGDTARVELRVEENARCIVIDGRSDCGLAPGPGDGYAFLLSLDGAPGWLLSWLALGWSFVLGVAIALPFGGLGAIAAGVVSVAAQSILASTTPDLGLPVAQAASLLAGAGGGTLLHSWLLHPSASRREHRHGQDQFIAEDDPTA